MNPDLDPERRLALAYVPADRRPALEALWRLDVALGQVLATGTDPMISRIRLAWWREALERLDREKAPAEPILQALAAEVVPKGVSGAELATMVDGWEVLVEPGQLGPSDLDDYASARGGLLFRHAARLLGGDEHPVDAAGARWALADLARRCGTAAEAKAAIEAAGAATPDRHARLSRLSRHRARRSRSPGRPRPDLANDSPSSDRALMPIGERRVLR
jgi:phytoene synthase